MVAVAAVEVADGEGDGTLIQLYLHLRGNRRLGVGEIKKRRELNCRRGNPVSPLVSLVDAHNQFSLPPSSGP